MTNTITNIVVGAATVQGAIPINWTTVIGVITFCLTAMATLINIFSNKNKSVTDESLRSSPFMKELIESNKERFQRHDAEIEQLDRDVNSSINDIRDSINNLRVEIERLKVESTNGLRTLEDLRNDYRILVKRLDDILKQLVEWVN